MFLICCCCFWNWETVLVEIRTFKSFTTFALKRSVYKGTFSYMSYYF